MKLNKHNFIKCCLEGIKPEKGWGWRFRAVPSKYCHASGKLLTKETITVYSSYWKAVWFPCHKDHLQELTQENNYLCQVLDASCNDCKYFERGERIDNRSSNGMCKKLDTPVVAIVNWPMHMDCFEHRKD